MERNSSRTASSPSPLRTGRGWRSPRDSNDTTPGFLGTKLVAGANVILTELNDGANETLEIASVGGGGGAGTLHQAYLGGSTIWVLQGDPVHIDAYDAYEALNLDGYLGLRYLAEYFKYAH